MPTLEAISLTRQVEATRRLPSRAFVPLDSLVRPSTQGESLWNGEPPRVVPPTTIASAIFEAELHMTVMDLRSSEPDAIPGSAKHPVKKGDALRHVFITRQQVDGDDPIVAARRMGEVPPNIDSQALYNNFRKEARERANTSVATRKHFSIDIAGVHDKLEKNLDEGMNPHRAYFEAALDLVEKSWAARDARRQHDADHGRKLTVWRANAGQAEREHDAAIKANKPRGFDGRPLQDHPAAEVVYQDYKHLDDPV